MVRLILVLVLFVGAVFGVYGAETYLAFIGKSAADARHASRIAQWRRAGIEFDPRTKLEVIQDLRNKGILAYPKINPVTLIRPNDAGTKNRSSLSIDGREIVPLGGPSNSTVVSCNESGERLIYVTDEHGFHNPPGLWSLGKTDIAVVGDSFGEGACVPSNLNAVARLRSLYPRTLNLSMGGNGPLMELAVLSEFLPTLRPRIVLWFFFAGNDLRDLLYEAKSPLLMRYLEDGYSQNILHSQPKIDRALKQRAEREIRKFSAGLENRKSGWADILFLRNLRGGVDFPRVFKPEANYDMDYAIGLLKEVLNAGRRKVQSWGGQAVFVYLPSIEGLVEERRLPTQGRLRDKVFQAAREAGFATIDVAAVFLEFKRPEQLSALKTRSHYNPDGYALVAHAIKSSGVLERLSRLDD